MTRNQLIYKKIVISPPPNGKVLLINILSIYKKQNLIRFAISKRYQNYIFIDLVEVIS